MPATARARLRAVINQFQKDTKTPGVLAGVWSPQGNWVVAQGVANLATGARLSTDMQYKIGSLTKTFTADVILQLVGEGKVSLNDHIAKWIPGVPNGSNITIRELLSHTSGLGDISYDSDDVDNPSTAAYARFQAGCTSQELVRSGLPPVAAPGAIWSYSNYGYELLGRVAELVTGQSLSTLIKKRITAPLGMRRTYLPASGSGLTVPYAHGYLAQVSGGPIDFSSLTLSCAGAAGGMVSTLSDMHKWSVALGTGRLLKPRVWAEARRDQVLADPLIPLLTRSRITDGLGFFEIGGFFGHQGDIQGYDSATFYSPALHMTVAVADTGVLTNGVIPVGTTALAQELAMAAYGHPLFGLVPGQAIAPFSPAEIQQIKARIANA
jgi:D-alanyl-D-alanine carboxypeptidase